MQKSRGLDFRSKNKITNWSKFDPNDEEIKKLSLVLKATIDKVEELRGIMKNPYGVSILEEPWLVGGMVYLE